MKKNGNDDGMGSIIIRDIDEGLRKKFRLLCIEANVSMNLVLKQCIQAVVEKGKLK